MVANEIRDHIRRAEARRDAYIKLRSEAANANIAKDTSEAVVTDNELEIIYSGSKFGEYDERVVGMQNEVATLKTMLNNINNVKSHSKTFGYAVDIHELLVDLAFVTSEITAYKSMSNNGMRPSIRKASTYRTTGVEYIIPTYNAEQFESMFNSLLDRQSSLRRDIDFRNETLEIS